MQEAFPFRFLHVFSAFYMTDNALVRTRLLRLYLSDYRIQRKRQDNQHDDDGDGTAEEVGDQSALGGCHDQGTAEVGLQDVGQNHAQHQGSRLEAVNLHQIAQKTEHL